MQKQQISKFFEEAGFIYHEMEVNRFYPITGWEILTHTPEGNDWRKVTHLVRKEPCVPVIVKFNNTQLLVSPEHRFWVSCGGAECWVEAVDLVEEKSEVRLLHENGEWVVATFEAGTHEIDILDITVDEVESYFSDGVLSHNTMYGDPTAVPGGNAIPFHASVRIKLGAGQQVKGANDAVIGINVSAKTIKNKVGPPFRSASFQIHFGKGIVEHEEIFDLLRNFGKDMVDDHEVAIEGAGAWKTLTVMNSEGVNILTRKFYKNDFGDVMKDPEASRWIEGLLEKAMVKTQIQADDIDIDSESYEEVKSLADQLTESGYDISPE